MAHQGTYTIFNAISDLHQGLTRPDILLRPLPHLTMNLGALIVVGQEIIVHAVEEALFFIRGSKGVFVRILNDLSYRIGGVGEQVRNWDPRSVALRF